jgi:hypothetical protein
MPLALAAERYLRGLVLDGPLGPGMLAPLEEIARHLGISRQPVRDAAARLADDGVLEILQQVGCRVPHPTPAVVADFSRLFAATEAVVVRLGEPERRTPDEATAFVGTGSPCVCSSGPRALASVGHRCERFSPLMDWSPQFACAKVGDSPAAQPAL